MDLLSEKHPWRLLLCKRTALSKKSLEETFSDLLLQTKINHKDGYLYLLLSIKANYITEGMEKGIEKGMEKGKLEVAENLLRLGMGIAHALDKPTILITKRPNDVPFDVKSKYLIIYQDYNDLEEKLAVELTKIFTSSDLMKSPV